MKFLSLEKEIFGLDISDRSLKLVLLRKKGERFSIASFNHMDLPEGVIEEGVIKQEDAFVKIINILCKNVRGKRLKTNYVAASLPEEKSFLQVIQMPKMEPWELKSAIAFEAENYIPLPMSEVYLDYQTIIPIKDNDNHSDVMIVATPKKIVQSYTSCLKKANLIPVALEVESQAIARAMIKNEMTEHPIVLVDFGKTSTIFIIFAGRSIQFTCSIPVSSQQLTESIATDLGIHEKKAEEIKERYGLVSTKIETSKKAAKAMKPVLGNLVEQIKKYMSFYQDHASHEHLSGNYTQEKMILCGGGANLKGLPEFLSQELQIPVELGNVRKNIILQENSVSRSLDLLSLTTALGMALRGTNKPQP